MALMKCPECKKDISDTALACPQCGYKIPVPLLKQKLGFGGTILAVVIIVAFFSILSTVMDRPPQTKVIEACDQKVAGGLIAQWQKGGVVHEIKNRGIYIKDAWYLLSLNDKTLLDGVIQCSVTGTKNDPVLLLYYDFRSGKTLATSSPQLGFQME